MNRKGRRFSPLAAGAAALLLVAALGACGGDDSSSASTAAADTTTAASAAPTTTAGSSTPTTEGSATTDAATPTTAAAGDALAPKPLAKETEITIGQEAPIEGFASLWMADVTGEFAKENIKIKWVNAGPSDRIVLLATGRIDISPMSPAAGVFNAIAGDSDIKWVMPTFTNPEDGTAGVWLRTDVIGNDTPETFDYTKLKGMKIGATGGRGTTGSYGLYLALKKVGLSLKDVDIVTMAAPDQIIALENGSIDGAILNDPFTSAAAEAGSAKLLVQQPTVSSLGGYFFGPNLLDGDPLVGQAVARAVARTVAANLQGDYHADPATAQILMDELQLPPERLASTPSLEWDPKLGLDPSVIPLLEEAYRGEGDLAYDEPLKAEDVIDTSFVDAVFGK